MGRLRTVNIGLPPHVKKRGKQYYFDHGMVRGRRKYTPLGSNKEAALQKRLEILFPEKYAKDAPPRRNYLYRHYDSAGGLLYVGISVSALLRLVDHRIKSGWYDSIATITIEKFLTRKEALAAETRAIATENPQHNVKKPRFEENRATNPHMGRTLVTTIAGGETGIRTQGTAKQYT